MNGGHLHHLNTIGAVMGAAAFLAIIGSSASGWSPRSLDRRITALEARPVVIPAALAPTPEPAPTVLTYSQWRASEPRTIATRDEAETALIEAGMTPRAAASLSWLAANCESPARDRNGESIGINLTSAGDSGQSVGAFQIHTPAHPWAREMYLHDLNESAKAATRVWLEAGRSLSPWSCK